MPSMRKTYTTDLGTDSATAETRHESEPDIDAAQVVVAELIDGRPKNVADVIAAGAEQGFSPETMQLEAELLGAETVTIEGEGRCWAMPSEDHETETTEAAPTWLDTAIELRQDGLSFQKIADHRWVSKPKTTVIRALRKAGAAEIQLPESITDDLPMDAWRVAELLDHSADDDATYLRGAHGERATPPPYLLSHVRKAHQVSIRELSKKLASRTSRSADSIRNTLSAYERGKAKTLPADLFRAWLEQLDIGDSSAHGGDDYEDVSQAA